MPRHHDDHVTQPLIPNAGLSRSASPTLPAVAASAPRLSGDTNEQLQLRAGNEIGPGALTDIVAGDQQNSGGARSVPGDEVVLTVRQLNGETLELRARAQDTIENIKLQLYEKRQIPPDEQRLLMGNTELAEDERSLDSYKIQNGAILHLILRLPLTPAELAERHATRREREKLVHALKLREARRQHMCRACTALAFILLVILVVTTVAVQHFETHSDTVAACAHPCSSLQPCIRGSCSLVIHSWEPEECALGTVCGYRKPDSYTVRAPIGTNQVYIAAWGGGGAGSFANPWNNGADSVNRGGYGGYAEGQLKLSPFTTMKLIVAGGGAHPAGGHGGGGNGGGVFTENGMCGGIDTDPNSRGSGGGGGGGASSVFIGDEVIPHISAAGGGGSSCGNLYGAGSGGDAGRNGLDGADNGCRPIGGQAGSADGPGVGGHGSWHGHETGGAGSNGMGGNGVGNAGGQGQGAYSSGGGGGGYPAGGAGGNCMCNGEASGGGGGYSVGDIVKYGNDPTIVRTICNAHAGNGSLVAETAEHCTDGEERIVGRGGTYGIHNANAGNVRLTRGTDGLIAIVFLGNSA